MISLKILIADDDFLTRMDLQEMLTEMKHTVVGTAKNGREALELTHKFRPDMVIMDVKMPKMDGLKAAKLITGQKLAAVLLLTAYGDSEIIKKAIDAGVVGYLTKPFSESDLSPAIQITWERYKEFMKLKKQKVNLKEKIEEDKRIQKSYNRC